MWFFVHAQMKQTLSPRLLIPDNLIFYFIIAKVTPHTQIFEEYMRKQNYDMIQLIQLLNPHFVKAFNTIRTFYKETANFVANGDPLWEQSCLETVTTIEFLLR